MKSIQKGPYSNTEKIQSRKGVEFISFAKSRKYQQELYEDLVAPYFNSGDYYVETWRHGQGNLPSNCTKDSKVYNIESINFKSNDISFETMKDHSKWMSSSDRNLICVGDINRQKGQIVRGGGTVCTTALPKVASLYKNLIGDVETCRRSNHIEKTRKRNH